MPQRPDNSQLRPGRQVATPGNQYSRRRFLPSDMRILRGTVLIAYQGIQYYDVATDFGRYMASYAGGTFSQLGAKDGSGFMPGQQVLLAVSPGRSAFNAFIIGGMDIVKAGTYTPPEGLLVYPQVAGYAYGERMSGAAYAKYPRLRNMGTGIQDQVDGDWIKHSRFGSALGVEGFRAFLQAGSAAGVFAYADDDHLRLVGSRFERYTFGEEYEDRQNGPSVNYIGRRSYYPGDALVDRQPQTLEVGGGAYFGHDQFLGAPELDYEGSSVPEATQGRPALLHEYRGADGTYLLTSAKSIVFQKWVGIPMPVEIRGSGAAAPTEEEAEDGPTCNGCELTADLRALPISPGTTYQAVQESQPLASMLAGAGVPINPTRYVDQLIVQALAGFRGLPEQWQVKPIPTLLTGGVSTNQQYFRDPHMWKSLPKSYALEVGPNGQVKRYQLGRGMIAILEDGSVVLQDPHGSQIALSGGNIYLQAEKDIISVAGRNKFDLAGRDAAVRADRHVDINATTGRMTAVAGSQMTIAGGLDGFGGVFIESQGQYDQTNAASGEQPATAGGVFIKSKTAVGVRAGSVMVQARNTGWSGTKDGAPTITLDAIGGIAWKAKNSKGLFGSEVFFDLAGGFKILLGRTSVFENIAARGSGGVLYKRIAYVGDDTSSYDYKLELQSDGATKLLDIANSAASPMTAGFVARWLSSEQHNLKDKGQFSLPRPEWQTQAIDQLPPASIVVQAVFRDMPMNGTSAFPGFVRWQADGLAISTDGLSVEYKPIDGTLLKGI